MKKPILTFLLGGLTVFVLGAAYPGSGPAPDPNPASSIRYQLRDTENVVVIDTWTGEVWRHVGDWNSLGQLGE